MHCHHIVASNKGGTSDLENCIPLCLNCHAEVGQYDDLHPLGLKYRPDELRKRRDSFYASISSQNSSPNLERVATDRATLLGILAKLPGNSDAVYLLKTMDFGGYFEWSTLESLRSFIRDHKGPEHEFLDEHLEEIRAQLIEKFVSFLRLLALYTVDDGSRLTSLSRTLRDNDETLFRQRQDELNEAATDAYETYVNFVRTARNSLLLKNLFELS